MTFPVPRRVAAHSGVAAWRERARGWLAARAATRWGRRLGIVLGSVTGAGWGVVVGVTLALVLVRVAGWLEAGVFAVVGLTCLALAVVSVLGRSAAQVAIVLPNPRTRVGQTALGELQVHNARARRARAGVVELPVGAAAARFAVPSLAAHAEWSEVFGVPARRRGVVVIGPARSVRGDALGLLRTVQRWARPVRLLIHPMTVRVPFNATGFAADIEGVTTAKLSSSDVSFHALRDYAPGDDRRHVHWPTTARVGRLTVRQFEETRRSHHLIVLDSQASAWRGDDFEVAVSVAASLALAGIARGSAVSLSTASGWVSTASSVRLLDGLAELALTDPDASLTDRVRRAVAARPGASVMTVICPRRVTDAELSRWPGLAGVDVDTGVVRVGATLTPARSRVGRATVADCPALDHLPRLVQRRGAA